MIESKPDSLKAINELIKTEISNGNLLTTNDISDGYHTFGELYDHRIEIFMALCRVLANSPGYLSNYNIWKSEYHNDGSSFHGWFVLGIEGPICKQLTYHLPMSKWEACWFAPALPKAPEFDGHTAADVLTRMRDIV